MENIEKNKLKSLKKSSVSLTGSNVVKNKSVSDCSTNSNCCDSGAQSGLSSCCDTGASPNASSCCDTSANEPWIIGQVKTPIGLIPKVSTKLSNKDKVGEIKGRLGIERMTYSVKPGLYAIGNPIEESPVLVTANYKLTFDKVRVALNDENLWLLVLDTNAVNVWCAAGKGTFGTKELLSRIEKTKISSIVTKKTLILPQLGATGICSYEVSKKTGFKVLYGPVRIEDYKEYKQNGYVATDKMRIVKFPLADRAILTPIEIISAVKKAIVVFGILFLLNLFLVNPFGLVDFYAYSGAILAGCFFTPILLPFIPGRAFMWKGLLLGLIWAFAVNFINGFPAIPTYGMVRAIGYLLLLPAISGYYAMNFTGSSTYTSLSGVTKEMKISIPILITMAFLGGVAILLNGFGIL